MEKKIKRFLSILRLLLISSVCVAQDFAYPGARSLGLASTTASLADEFSVLGNPGTLGLLEFPSIGTGYLNMFGIEGLSSSYAAISIPFLRGFTSVGVFTFGDEIFQRNRLSLGFGNRFGLAGLGASVNYNHYLIEGFGARGFISLDVGGLAEISQKFNISALIKNITQAKVSKLTGEYMPTLMTLGLAFYPSSQVLLTTQYDKDLLNPGLLKFGLEYTYSSLVLRSGFITNPSRISFGTGLHFKKFKIDYGIMMHQALGSTQSISISYCFRHE